MSDDEADPELLALLRQHLGMPAADAEPDTGVLRDAEAVYDDSIDVAIDMRATKAAAQTIYAQMQRKEFAIDSWSSHELHPTPSGPDDEETLNFVFILDLLNFSFWSELPDEERFAIEYRDRTWTGYWSLVAALRRALDEMQVANGVSDDEDGSAGVDASCADGDGNDRGAGNGEGDDDGGGAAAGESAGNGENAGNGESAGNVENAGNEDDVGRGENAGNVESAGKEDDDGRGDSDDRGAGNDGTSADGDGPVEGDHFGEGGDSADSSHDEGIKGNGQREAGSDATKQTSTPKRRKFPITSPAFWQDEAECTLDALRHVFRSATQEEMPMLAERLDCLRDAGRVLSEEYGGSVANLVRAANGSAARLVNLLARDFGCFRDEHFFDGRRRPVRLLKRAQIFVADVWACFGGRGFGAFRDIDKITMFADYRVPQILNTLGCLYYSPPLASTIHRGELIESGSRWELQLRACSIWCVELLRREILKQHPDAKVNAILIDFFLYDTMKELEAAGTETVRHHRTRSIWY